MTLSLQFDLCKIFITVLSCNIILRNNLSLLIFKVKRNLRVLQQYFNLNQTKMCGIYHMLIIPGNNMKYILID